jgi:hypothetical protein
MKKTLLAIIAAILLATGSLKAQAFVGENGEGLKGIISYKVVCIWNVLPNEKPGASITPSEAENYATILLRSGKVPLRTDDSAPGRIVIVGTEFRPFGTPMYVHLTVSVLTRCRSVWNPQADAFMGVVWASVFCFWGGEESTFKDRIRDHIRRAMESLIVGQSSK